MIILLADPSCYANIAVMTTDIQERKLRLAESAASSAVYNGCDPNEVLARCRAGIAEGAAASGARHLRAQRDTPETRPHAANVTPGLSALSDAFH